MLKKMKKKIGFSLRLYGYQVAMSIYTLMVTVPIGALSSSFFAKLIAVVFSIALYLVIVYFAAHELGGKDYIGRENPIDPPKATDGFVYALMAQAVNIVFIIMLAVPVDTSRYIAQIAMNFTDYMYIPKSFIKDGIPISYSWLWYIAAAVPQIAVTGIGYMFGFKGIKISTYFKLDKKEIHSSPNEDDPDLDK